MSSFNTVVLIFFAIAIVSVFVTRPGASSVIGGITNYLANAIRALLGATS